MAPIVDITSRRVALSRLLALSISVPLAPQRAPALEAATSDVRKLASVRDKASELLGALPKLAEEDSPMYITQFASLNLKPASAALAALAPRLDAPRADALAIELGERVARISAAGRERELKRVEMEAKDFMATLDNALALVAAVYAVPAPPSKGDGKFSTGTYFGPFACEGIPGLKRKPESNECEDIKDQ